jgi:hypothetical protein
VLSASTSLHKKIKWPDDYFYLSHTLLYQRYQVNNYGSLFVFANGFSNNLSYTFTIGRSSISAPIYPREGSDILFSAQFTPPPILYFQIKIIHRQLHRKNISGLKCTNGNLIFPGLPELLKI